MDWAFVAVMIGTSNLLISFSEMFCFPYTRIGVILIIMALMSYVSMSNYKMVQGWYRAQGDGMTNSVHAENRKSYLIGNLICVLFGSIAMISWIIHRAATGATPYSLKNLQGLFAIYGCYATGMLFNIFSIPERFFINHRKNYHVFSHPIFHVLVVVGGTLTWKTYYDFLSWRALNDCEDFP
jgi:hypothetical protein